MKKEIICKVSLNSIHAFKSSKGFKKMKYFLRFKETLTSMENNNETFRSFRAKKTFIRKKLGHIAVSAIKASSVTL